MLTNVTFKIAALGSTFHIERLCSSISSPAIIITRLPNVPEALDILKRESFNVVVIDSLHEEAQLACQSISKVSLIPIALLVTDKGTNWDKVYYWNVDGYVSEESGNTEILARIKAISRRKVFRSSTKRV
jgi:DNA-binding response OmpR family regulator